MNDPWYEEDEYDYVQEEQDAEEEFIFFGIFSGFFDWLFG
jgi:hypothetical protein